MILTNKFKNYSRYETRAFETKSAQFLEIFKKANGLLVDARNLKVKPKPIKTEENKDNIIFLDPSVEVEFRCLDKEKVTVKEAFDVYERWFAALDELTEQNQARLHHPKLLAHVANVLIICATIQEILQVAADMTPGGDLPDLPPGPKAG